MTIWIANKLSDIYADNLKPGDIICTNDPMGFTYIADDSEKFDLILEPLLDMKNYDTIC